MKANRDDLADEEEKNNLVGGDAKTTADSKDKGAYQKLSSDATER